MPIGFTCGHRSFRFASGLPNLSEATISMQNCVCTNAAISDGSLSSSSLFFIASRLTYDTENFPPKN